VQELALVFLGFPAFQGQHACSAVIAISSGEKPATVNEIW
jgi:hypothetical protein